MYEIDYTELLTRIQAAEKEARGMGLQTDGNGEANPLRGGCGSRPTVQTRYQECQARLGLARYPPLGTHERPGSKARSSLPKIYCGSALLRVRQL